MGRWCSPVNMPPCHGGDRGFKSLPTRQVKPRRKAGFDVEKNLPIFDVFIQLSYTDLTKSIFILILMRQVLSISLPLAEIRSIKRMARRRGHPSVSRFIHTLVQTERDAMSESELLKIVRRSRKEYRLGKSVKAKGIADLL